MSELCKICSTKSAKSNPVDGDYYEQFCEYCGHFKISGSAAETYLEGDKAIQKLRGHIHRFNASEDIPCLTTENIPSIVNSPFPTVAERAEFLLQQVHLETKYLGAKIEVLSKKYLGLTYSLVDNDIRFLSDYLESEGLVQAYKSTSSLSLSVTPAGYAFIENYKRFSKPDAKTAFVAMWFASEVQSAYSNGIKEVIKNCGYEPIRVDEVHHHEKIDDRILRSIRDADFVVADLTGHRGGVYFEAGFAIALNKPVIWTCRSDHFGGAHFDVNHYQFIVWESDSDLQKKLEDKLVGLFGRK
ncbi:MAG: nucleoside 2-deoxyribosyltransferase [Pseudomonadota bacterium]